MRFIKGIKKVRQIEENEYVTIIIKKKCGHVVFGLI